MGGGNLKKTDDDENGDQVKNQIQQLRKDVQNLHLNLNNDSNELVENIFFGWWKDWIVDQTVLGLAEATLPVIASTIPLADHVISYSLGGVQNVGYAIHGGGCKIGLLRETEDNEQPEITSRGFIVTDTIVSSYNVAQDFDEFFFVDDDDDDDEEDDGKQRKEQDEGFNVMELLLRTIVGVSIGTALFFFGLTFHTIQILFPKSQIVQWIQTIHDFKVFIVKSGIAGTDFFDSVADLVPNMMLLSKIQKSVGDRIQSDTLASRTDIQEGY